MMYSVIGISESKINDLSKREEAFRTNRVDSEWNGMHSVDSIFDPNGEYKRKKCGSI